METLYNTLAKILAEADIETLGDTLGDVDCEALVDTSADPLSTPGHVKKKAVIKKLAVALEQVR